jgi:hypothetical protein
MAVLRADSPLSSRQRHVNKAVLVALPTCGIALGLESARETARISSGYLASYYYASTFSISVIAVLFGLLMLIYRRTRRFGGGLIAAGILTYAVFIGGMFVLWRTDHVAWRHEEMISFGPDQKASVVVYFRNGISGREVEDFDLFVLQAPSTQHQGRDFPAFVQTYLSLGQASGHEGIALVFRNNAPAEKVSAYLQTIKTDKRVYKVFLDTVPNSIHIDSEHP